MYGLMKAHTCSRHGEAASLHRQHYCGTCKTMGSLYGQKSRFLLNNDAVFLSELLTALSNDTPDTWGRAYHSYNCMTLPGNEAPMPPALQIAASATLLMTEFKVADQVADSTRRGWKMAQRVFSQEFYRAAEHLQEVGFPLKEIRDWYDRQEEREAEARQTPKKSTAAETVALVAEPTATVTGIVFRQGAAALGCSAATQEAMYRIGFAFGSIVYLLDACEDYAKDRKNGEFNAVRTAWNEEAESIFCTETREGVLALLHQYQQEFATALRDLPLPTGQTSLFASRLKTNLNRRLGIPQEATSCATRTTPFPAKPTLQEKWKTAAKVANDLSAKYVEDRKGKALARLTRPLVSLHILGIALLFPREAQSTESYRECRDIAFNLIALGGMLQSLTARVPALPAFAGANNATPPVHLAMNSGLPQSTETVKKVRRQRGSCCDGCCEGCDCACCLCEGGECCAGCCEGGACCCDGCSCGS